MKLIVYHVSDNIKSQKAINALEYINNMELDEIDKDYYMNETKAKKEIMNKKMKFIRSKYGKVGKYFDEIDGGDIDG